MSASWLRILTLSVASVASALVGFQVAISTFQVLQVLQIFQGGKDDRVFPLRNVARTGSSAAQVDRTLSGSAGAYLSRQPAVNAMFSGPEEPVASDLEAA